MQAWSFKDISTEAVETIEQLFMSGMTPGTAYQEFTFNLRLQCGSEMMKYHKSLADRGICPRRRDFNMLYTEFNRKKYGGSDSEAMLKIFKDRIIDAKETHPDIKVSYSKYTIDSPLLVAIVTPLMQRIHQYVSESGELVFIDSSSNMDEYHLQIFLLVTQSVISALRLGILITSDEKTESLIKGFNLLKGCFDENSFFARGREGPEIGMTDNSIELRDALSSVFLNMKLRLCTFHMLQQV